MTRSAILRSGGALAAATTVANVAGYAFGLVLSRALGPADYGALGALIGLAVIGTIPGQAVQLTVARQVVRAPGGTLPFALGLVVAVAALVPTLVLTALSAPVAAVLRLDSPAPVIWLALLLLPHTIVGVPLGLMLGRDRIGRFALAQVLVALPKLAAGCLAAVASWGVTGAMAATSLAALLSTVAVAWLAAPLPAWTGAPGFGLGALVREVANTAAGFAGVLVLLNVDVLVARIVLSPVDSGLYAVGTVFGKMMFWGTQFFGPLAFARSLHGSARSGSPPSRRPLLAAVLAIGSAGVVGAHLFGAAFLHLTVGDVYEPVGRSAALFALAGVALAVLQVVLHADLAQGSARTSKLTWVAAAGSVLLVLLVSPASAPALIGCHLMAITAVLAVAGRHLRGTSAPSLPTAGEPPSRRDCGRTGRGRRAGTGRR